MIDLQTLDLPELNLIIKKGEFVGLYGPTGSGKTTLLNEIYKKYIKSHRISYVFQENRLIGHLSCEKNVSLVLENQMSCVNAKNNAGQWLEIFDLSDKRLQTSKKISGGEAQRVNIARAFAWNGEIFLLDEPFSAQDEFHKKIIFEQIQKLRENHFVVIVSHNYTDLVELGCKIVKL